MQWQELHRQASIFKYIMASTPVPPHLLFSLRTSSAGHSLISNTVGRGCDYLNLRFTGSNGDLEPGRCRRTDGKKWRCSKAVAPGQKYCDRHVHRARPRSRKPVEQSKKAGAAAAAHGAEALSTTSVGMNRATPTATTNFSSATAMACAQPYCTRLLPCPDREFPFQLMASQNRKLRSLHLGGVDSEAEPVSQQRQLQHSKMDLRNAYAMMQQQYEDDTRLNDQNGCSFRTTGIASLEDVAEPDRRGNPRPLIDAWSRENPFEVTICDNKNQNETSSGSSSSPVRSLGNLCRSSLTLSMSGTPGGVDSEDQEQIGQVGHSNSDSGKTMVSSWMNTMSPMGGPLAEVLQTSNTVAFHNERAGGGNIDVIRGCAGVINLMSKTGWDGEGASPRDSRASRGFSSATGTFVSLSDSSGHSSPTLGGARCQSWPNG